MNSVTPFDSSIYSAINNSIFPVAPMDTLPSATDSVKPIADDSETEQSPNNNPDLNNYYKNVQYSLTNEDATLDFVKSAGNLENAMVSAILNGFSVQDACNIKLAECAYKSNAYALKSTFELEV